MTFHVSKTIFVTIISYHLFLLWKRNILCLFLLILLIEARFQKGFSNQIKKQKDFTGMVRHDGTIYNIQSTIFVFAFHIL